MKPFRQAFLLTACSKYIFFLLLSSGFGFCTGMWVACETPLIIRTLRLLLIQLIVIMKIIMARLGPPDPDNQRHSEVGFLLIPRHHYFPPQF